MPIIKTIHSANEAQQLYQRAIGRMQADLGWAQGEAHATLAQLAAGYGVFLHDVAAAVLSAPSLAGGPGAALRQVVFQRRAA